MAERLAAMFPSHTMETYTERHRFDPPNRVEPSTWHFALWQRAEH